MHHPPGQDRDGHVSNHLDKDSLLISVFLCNTTSTQLQASPGPSYTALWRLGLRKPQNSISVASASAVRDFLSVIEMQHMYLPILVKL